MAKTPRRRCKICREWFHPRSFNEWWCSPEHGAVFGIQERDKQRQKATQKAEAQRKEQTQAERRSLKTRKIALKTKSDWNKEAQIAVNRFIYWRDYGKPCIACGRPLNYGVRGGAVDASHYRSRGAAPHLRFNVFNNHAGCVHCNRDLSGNLIPYRINLIEKISAFRVERIEHDNTPRKFDIAYLQRVKSIFTRRAKHYEKLRKRQLEAA